MFEICNFIGTCFETYSNWLHIFICITLYFLALDMLEGIGNTWIFPFRNFGEFEEQFFFEFEAKNKENNFLIALNANMLKIEQYWIKFMYKKK